jgi:hypothetical protein
MRPSGCSAGLVVMRVYGSSSAARGIPGDGTAIRGTISSRNLRISVATILVLLSAQGWTGDFANLFSPYPAGASGASASGVLQALQRAGIAVLYHALGGALIVAAAAVILALSFRSSDSKWVRVFAVLGLAAVLSAAAAGALFLLSDHPSAAYSAQMGGSFIGAYAFYFLVLYSTKK